MTKLVEQVDNIKDTVLFVANPKNWFNLRTLRTLLGRAEEGAAAGGGAGNAGATPREIAEALVPLLPAPGANLDDIRAVVREAGQETIVETRGQILASQQVVGGKIERLENAAGGVSRRVDRVSALLNAPGNALVGSIENSEMVQKAHFEVQLAKTEESLGKLVVTVGREQGALIEETRNTIIEEHIRIGDQIDRTFDAKVSEIKADNVESTKAGVRALGLAVAEGFKESTTTISKNINTTLIPVIEKSAKESASIAANKIIDNLGKKRKIDMSPETENDEVSLLMSVGKIIKSGGGECREIKLSKFNLDKMKLRVKAAPEIEAAPELEEGAIGLGDVEDPLLGAGAGVMSEPSASSSSRLMLPSAVERSWVSKLVAFFPRFGDNHIAHCADATQGLDEGGGSSPSSTGSSTLRGDPGGSGSFQPQGHEETINIANSQIETGNYDSLVNGAALAY